MRPDLARDAGQRTRDELVVAPSAAPVAAPAAVPPDAGEDEITAKVLAIVAEQTGYPPDMLELDLDLEADLGVDTVKQAETFAAIRATFDIPRRDDLQLRDYPTLEKVIGFVRAMRPDLARDAGQRTQDEVAVAPSPTAAAPAASAVTTIGTLAAADEMPRRVPVPTLRPPVTWCKPTGVTLDENSRVIVALDNGGLGKALIGRLQKRGVTVLELETGAGAEAITTQIQAWLAEGEVQGVYWLPAFDVEPPLTEMDFTAWRGMNQQRVKNLYATMRALYDTINGPNHFLISATHLGGLHGYGPAGASAPLGGAVTGFTKAYKRERSDVLVKAVDFEVSRRTAQPADALIEETLTDPGIVEVGYYQDQRYAVTLVEQSARDGGAGLTLNRDTIFLVTGAAGGITSAIIADLAANSGGTFYLLDLVPAPDANDPHIALFRRDKEALKQALIADMRAAGERPTPVVIDKKLMAVERDEAALRAIEAVQAAGGTAHYRSVNLLDHASVSAVMAEIQQRHGRLDVLVHAGGLEISRALNDKDAAQFNLVFDVKADGFFSLLHAAREMPIGATVAFSSVAGRFGNSGQTDYSAANDLLCKITSSMRQWRPGTRGIVIDWTAWGGIGMATRGSIPKIMEAAGITMLPPEAGVPTVRRELTYGGFKGEVVVAGELGMMMDEWDETGGLDGERAAQALTQRQPSLLMVGEVKAARLYGGLEAETTLDPQAQPFLYDHAMDGTPLLPGVMGTETLAELATVLAPDYHVSAVRDVQFLNPFKFYRMEPQTLYLQTRLEPAAEGGLLAYCTLRSLRRLAKPGLPPQEKLHFSATVHLQAEPVAAPAPAPVAWEEADGIDREKIYDVFFHGPAYQVLEKVALAGDAAVGLMPLALPPNTQPQNVAALMTPRLIELVFQTAGMWKIQRNGGMALPLSIARVSAFRQPADGTRLYAAIRARDNGDAFDGHVVDDAGNVYVTVEAYRTIDIPEGF